MKRFISALAFLCLALPAVAGSNDDVIREQFHAAQLHSGLQTGDVMIPVENRIRNRNSNCVYAACETAFVPAGYESFRGIMNRAVKEGWHGSGLNDVLAAIKDVKDKDGKPVKIEYKTQPSGSRSNQIFYDAVKEGVGCYFEIPGHALVLVGIDEQSVRIIDNNGPPQVTTWSRQKFDSTREGGAVFCFRRWRVRPSCPDCVPSTPAHPSLLPEDPIEPAPAPKPVAPAVPATIPVIPPDPKPDPRIDAILKIQQQQAALIDALAKQAKIPGPQGLPGAKGDPGAAGGVGLPGPAGSAGKDVDPAVLKNLQDSITKLAGQGFYVQYVDSTGKPVSDKQWVQMGQQGAAGLMTIQYIPPTQNK